MSQTIILPDDLYARLASVATQQGKTADDIVNTLVEQYVEEVQPPTNPPDDDENIEGYDPAADPLAPFIGAFKLGKDRSWVEQHDAIFGSRHADKE
jgi:hypothetical protein